MKKATNTGRLVGYLHQSFLSLPVRMDSAISCSVGFWVVLLFLISFQQTWATCVSSCGEIANISHPFRLKDDPKRCGQRKYELDCINNVTVVRLFAGEYHVKAINYTNFTIRLLDPDIQEDDCSSLPRYFLYKYNFSTHDSYFYESDEAPYHVFQNDISGDVSWLTHVIYLTCKDPVNTDDLYVNTTSCLDQHTYAIVGDLPVKRLKFGCHVKRVATYTYRYGVEPEDFVSYKYIHKKLAQGFELSWMHSICADYGCGSASCYFNQTDGNVLCSYYSGGTWPMFLVLTLDYIWGIWQGLLQIAGIYHSDYSSPIVVTGEITGRYILPYMTARFLLGFTVLLIFLVYKWRRRHISMYDDIEAFLQDNDLVPIRYTYKEIKNMTRGFKDKLGEGGYGSVYKGKLRSGPFVAIKMLVKSKANGQEFISEVATVGRIHHANVVRLVGFCAEGSKRALVYEFMPNGSLDKYIFSKDGKKLLNYEEIHKISLGVARGITYLHHGCDIQILHFDVKPHNILLDENFLPKVSDFGLAKLYPINDSIVTLTAARGTIGYMAPELFYKNIGGISYKADVYSFGMLLMEMAGRRKNLNPHAEHSSQLYFPLWIYDQFGEEQDIKMEDVTEGEKNIAKKMIIIALWCIQLKPCDRPSMSKVVQMLEGEVESLEMPPKPSLYPHETIAEDHERSSDQIRTGDSIGSSSYISEIASDPLLKNYV